MVPMTMNILQPSHRSVGDNLDRVHFAPSRFNKEETVKIAIWTKMNNLIAIRF
jgi:hypothetical protein